MTIYSLIRPAGYGRRSLLRSLASLAISISLAACTSIGDLPVTDESYRNWASHQARLVDINTWEIHARTAIYAEDKVYQVGINWQREIDLFTIVIEAPFGRGIFRLESNLPGGGRAPIKLSMPDGQVFFGDSAESLLEAVLGWSIPVSGLRSWIKGLPIAGSDYNFELRADGRLKSLNQDDWLINYLDYFSKESDRGTLPRKMYLKHSDLALKIVIERWQQFEAQVNSPVIFPDFD